MEKKNNSGMLVGMLIGIIIMLVVVGGLFATGTIGFKTTTTDNGQGSENNKSIKIDESKDYVYDAEYKYDNKYTEFDRTNGERKDTTIDYYGISVELTAIDYLKNLKVPFININSSDAQTVNKELENLYLKYAKDFDGCAEELKNQNGPGCSQILTYRTYKYNDILSIIVIDGIQGTSPFVFDYHTYNFNITTGKVLNYDEVLQKLNLDKSSTLETLKKNAKEKMDSLNSSWNTKNDLSNECQYIKDENGNPLYGTTNCYDITNLLLQKSIDSNEILYFVDDSGDLNVMMILYLAFAQNGDRNHYLIKVTK